jgi:acyl carrier protein
MDRTAIIGCLRRAFADAWIPLDIDLTDNALLDDIDGLDSVSRVRLILTLEQAFTVEISPKENSRLKTIGDLIDLIAGKL